jgi:hypothetical protein
MQTKESFKKKKAILTMSNSTGLKNKQGEIVMRDENKEPKVFALPANAKIGDAVKIPDDGPWVVVQSPVASFSNSSGHWPHAPHEWMSFTVSPDWETFTPIDVETIPNEPEDD